MIVPLGHDHLFFLVISETEALSDEVVAARAADLCQAAEWVAGPASTPYQPEKAKTLSEAILRFERVVYEAHSTDYQTEAALRNLVRDHFVILKVGPGLTYAAREALFALSHIEQEWVTDRPLSNIRAKLDKVMVAQPRYWEAYYGGTEAERA
jgi:tagatose-1,6-bisphosphate aldolase non-catalytic subunit AgaZ/GatZ